MSCRRLFIVWSSLVFKLSGDAFQFRVFNVSNLNWKQRVKGQTILLKNTFSTFSILNTFTWMKPRSTQLLHNNYSHLHNTRMEFKYHINVHTSFTSHYEGSPSHLLHQTSEWGKSFGTRLHVNRIEFRKWSLFLSHNNIIRVIVSSTHTVARIHLFSVYYTHYNPQHSPFHSICNENGTNLSAIWIRIREHTMIQFKYGFYMRYSPNGDISPMARIPHTAIILILSKSISWGWRFFVILSAAHQPQRSLSIPRETLGQTGIVAYDGRIRHWLRHGH